jgi:RNA polymerase sigma-70 factor (ECF subfamily)
VVTTTVVVTTTEATETASSPKFSPRAGGPDPGAAGSFVEKLFDEHGRMVLGLCRLLLRDPVEAEDAAQQVFLSAHASVLRGAVPRDAPRWLAAIARNECRARIQMRMREPLALPEVPSDLPDPLAAAIRAADLDAIWAAISSLPRHQRRALLLRELGGLSYHELGRALGVSHSAVESLLFRARQHVRRLLAAATPLAFRDELARLIPGFDPGTAGVAARVATLPIALKLATAAVSVGVVSTGAAQFPEHHERHRVLTPRAAAVTAPVRRDVRAAVPLAVRAVRDAPHHARRREGPQRGHDARAERSEHVEVSANEPVEVEQKHVEEHQGETRATSGSDSSGPGPAPSDSGSHDSSAPSGSDSHGGDSGSAASHSGSDDGSS